MQNIFSSTRISVLFFTAIFIALTPASRAQALESPAEHSEREAQLEKKVEALRIKYKWIGLTAAYSIDEKNIYSAASGMKKDPKQVLAPSEGANVFSKDSIMSLGSNSKPFTAVLIGRLVEKKEFNFNSSLGEVIARLNSHVPDAEKILKVSKAVSSITVDSILTHTSGIPDDYSKGGDELEPSVLYFLEHGSPRNNSRFLYSTFGYGILGYLASRFENMRWDQLIQKEIYDRLGMKRCTIQPGAFDHPFKEGAMASEAEMHFPKSAFPWGHIFNKSGGFAFQDPFVKADYEPINEVPGAGIFCNMEEWNKFLQFLLRGLSGKARSGEDPIADQSIFKHFFAVHKPDEYTYGAWQPGAKNFYHYGGSGGFTVVAIVTPALGESVTVGTNRANSSEWGSLHQMAVEISKLMRTLVHP